MGGDAGTGGDGDPGVITIDGQLIFAATDVGIWDAIVFLNGDLAHSTTTDRAGRFHFEGVEPPYDLTVVETFDWEERLVEFRGLSLANPALSLNGPTYASRRARAPGTFGGVTFPLPEGAEIQVGLTGVAADGNVRGDGADLYLRWKGPASYSGSFVGVLMQWRDDNALDFLQAGALTPFEIEDGVEQPVNLILDQAIETETTTVSVDPGVYSHQLVTKFASFNVLGATFTVERSVVRPSLPGTVSIPSEGARITLLASLPSSLAGATVVVDAVPDGETRLELPAEVVLETLAPGFLEVVSTTTPRLEWSAVPGATAYEVVIESGELRAIWILPPTVTFVDVPDLGPSLFRLPVGSDIRWGVFARMDPGYSPDEMADPNALAPPPYWQATREYTAFGRFSIAP